MIRKKHFISLSITSLILSLSTIVGEAANAGIKDTGEKGAEIYCFMRNAGNEHEVSWQSAYEVIKRQSTGLFKTSPRHGAVMIIEAVVDNPNNFEDCGLFLGDLFRPKANNLEDQINKIPRDKQNDSNNEELKGRYSYYISEKAR